MRQSVPATDDVPQTPAPQCGAIVRALREAAGVTQAGWAARLGYGRRTIQRWERDEGIPDEAATTALLQLCGELRLYRLYHQGALAGLALTADHLRNLLAEARLADRIPPDCQIAPPSTASELEDTRTSAPPRPAGADHNLPAELSTFIGREREVAAVTTALATARLVTLTGPGGVGKTRLALRTATNQLGHFADGIWLAELATIAPPTTDHPTSLPQAIARAIGVREQPRRTIEETLTDTLASRHLLLLLDNCEHLVADCAALAARLLLACPRLHILATSREPLGVPGELTWPVPPLACPQHDAQTSLAIAAETEAVQLFATRAASAWPGFTLHELNAIPVAHICRRLDGLPLAIELAAARVRTLTPAEIAARLDDRFQLLTSGSRTAPPRHQTLRAAIDWSFDLLDDQERRLFARLAIFANDFTLPIAEAVCAGDGLPQSAILDLLARLVDKSLLLADPSGADEPTRYRLHETLRAYGWERLVAHGEADRLRQRHIAWVINLAETASRAFHGPEQGTWLRQTERAHADIHRILGLAVERGDADTALRLCVALWWAWGVYERMGESRPWLERALALPTAATSPLRARALAHLAVYAAFQGDAAAAFAHLDEADALSQSLGDELALLAARGTRTLLFQVAGQFEKASETAQETLILARRLDDAWWEGRALEHLAASAVRRRDLATATARLEEGVLLARRTGDAWGLAMALSELGDMARTRGAHAEAGARYAESLALREGLGIPTATPSLHHNLGYVALALGDPPTAATRFREALAQFRHLGERRGVAECLIGLGAVAASAGRAETAVRLFAAGEAALEALGSTIWPSNRADYDRTLALAQTALTPATFAAAWATGRTLTLDQALALTSAL